MMFHYISSIFPISTIFFLLLIHKLWQFCTVGMSVHKAGDFQRAGASSSRGRFRQPKPRLVKFQWEPGLRMIISLYIIRVYIYIYQSIYIYSFINTYAYIYIYVYVYWVMCIPAQIYFNCLCIIRLDTTFQPLLQPPTLGSAGCFTVLRRHQRGEGQTEAANGCHGGTRANGKWGRFAQMGLSENRVYSQWNSHLIGIMISKTIGYNGVLTYFQTHPNCLSLEKHGWSGWTGKPEEFWSCTSQQQI